MLGMISSPLPIKILAVVFIVLCIALTTVVLMQEGKSAGFTGAINGAADTYMGKNRGRSIEGKLERVTKIFIFLFFVIAVVLNYKF